VRKEKGDSWIEVKSKVHVFVVGERSHPKTGEIYAKLEELGSEMKKLAYKSETQYDLHDVEEEQKGALEGPMRSWRLLLVLLACLLVFLSGSTRTFVHVEIVILL